MMLKSEELKRREIDAIEQRLKAATPGPWKYEARSDIVWFAKRNAGIKCSTNYSMTREDAEFIAHAPADISALIDGLEFLLRKIANIKSTLSQVEIRDKFFLCSTCFKIRAILRGEEAAEETRGRKPK